MDGGEKSLDDVPWRDQMKRYQLYFTTLLCLVAIWIALMKTKNDLFPDPALHRVIEITPLYILICFGCYCLAKLGYDLLVFRDDPSEIDALAEEVKEVKNELKAKGYKF